MKLWRLILLQLKVGFGLSALTWNLRHDRFKFLKSTGLALIIAVAVSPLFFFGYLPFLRIVYEQSSALNQGQVVITMALIFSSFLVFFFGIAYTMSAFHFSKDMSFLVPLPLQQRDILTAKFAVVLINDYLTVFPFLIPAVLVFGFNQQPGIAFWAMAAVILLFAPILPLAVVSVLILLLMRVTNLGTKKDTLRLLGMFGFIVVILILNVLFSSVMEGGEAELVQRILSQKDGLVNYIGRTYPPAIWATQALSSAGAAAVQNFILFIGTSLAAGALMFYLGGRIFYQGLIGGDETGARTGLSADDLGKKTSRSTSPIYAIAVREIKTLIRTPIYLFNSVAMLLIIPVILLIPAFTGGGGIGQSLEMLNNLGVRSLIVLSAAAALGGLAIFTPAASSTFSREGKLFWISQVIPVSPGQQIKGKILYSYIIVWLAVPLLIIFAFMAPLSFPETILAVLLGSVICFPVITISILVDLIRPYLHWDNPQKAIKQNINVVAAMVLSGAALYLIFIAGRFTYTTGVGDLYLYLTVFTVSLLLGTVPYAVLMKIADKRYRDINSQ